MGLKPSDRKVTDDDIRLQNRLDQYRQRQPQIISSVADKWAGGIGTLLAAVSAVGILAVPTAKGSLSTPTRAIVGILLLAFFALAFTGFWKLLSAASGTGRRQRPPQTIADLEKREAQITRTAQQQLTNGLRLSFGAFCIFFALVFLAWFDPWDSDPSSKILIQTSDSSTHCGQSITITDGVVHLDQNGSATPIPLAEVTSVEIVSHCP